MASITASREAGSPLHPCGVLDLSYCRRVHPLQEVSPFLFHRRDARAADLACIDVVRPRSGLLVEEILLEGEVRWAPFVLALVRRAAHGPHLAVDGVSVY
jgi:hypothetical protein